LAKLVRTSDDLQGNGREVIAGNILQGDKTGIQGIGIPFEVTFAIAAEEIRKDIVVGDSSIRITENAIEDFHQIEDFHLQMGLLKDFPGQSSGESFPGVHGTPGDGPLTVTRLFPPLHQHDMIVSEDDPSDSDDGVIGVPAFENFILQETKTKGRLRTPWFSMALTENLPGGEPPCPPYDKGDVNRYCGCLMVNTGQ